MAALGAHAAARRTGTRDRLIARRHACACRAEFINALRLTVYFALCGVLAAKPAVATDPFQRYVIFYNELPITIYPVITAVEKENGAACGTSADLRRIIVNQGTRGAGIPTGGTVTVTL